MPKITFEGKEYSCRKGEKVLDCLMRHGVMLPSSCRSGVCHSCMVRAVGGRSPVEAQSGIKDTLRAQGYFLACICEPEEDLEISLVASPTVRNKGILVSKKVLNDSVIRLRLVCKDGFFYRAGQFINLIRPEDGLVRSYSLASIPAESELELHVKRVPGGRMSNWIFDELEVGATLEFYGPSGDCFYLPADLEAGLLMVGIGTGFAPLYGIVRDALHQGHSGLVYFYHASPKATGLYMVETMRRLEEEYGNLHYIPCVRNGEPPDGGVRGHIVDVIRDHMPKLTGWRVYLCGDPLVVDTLKSTCHLAGAAIRDIHSDPFIFAPQGG